MAEGGPGKDENPFSFKKFVEKQSGDASCDKLDGSGGAETSNLPDIGLSAGADLVRHDTGVSEEKPVTKESKDGANPFSFKKFLQGGPQKSGSRSSGNSLATLDLANDLPDFVQNQSSTRDSHLRHQDHSVETSLPDFALDSAGARPRHHRHGSSDTDSDNETKDSILTTMQPVDPLHCDLPAPLDTEQESSHSSIDAATDKDVEDEDDPFSPTVMCAAHSTGGLPDFLSDSAIGGASAAGLIDRTDSEEFQNGFLSDIDSRVELQRLREENRGLKKKLTDAKDLADKESKRVAGVLSEMEAIQKREAEENAALESMIQQVEANLSTTTERAVKAESTITKLKQELKSLQAANLILQKENSALRQGQGQDSVREKTNYASQQLAIAAKSAEQSLKQLLGGVDTLKMVSDVLASIDKITETADSTRGADSQGGATGNSPDGATNSNKS